MTEPGEVYVVECTAAKPWDGSSSPRQRVRHADAKEVGDQTDGWPGGDIATYECPHCGHRWTVELPQ